MRLIGTRAKVLKKGTMSARIIRADGTIEELGVIAHYSQYRLVRWYWAVKLYIKAKVRALRA